MCPAWSLWCFRVALRRGPSSWAQITLIEALSAAAKLFTCCCSGQAEYLLRWRCWAVGTCAIGGPPAAERMRREFSREVCVQASLPVCTDMSTARDVTAGVWPNSRQKERCSHHPSRRHTGRCKLLSSLTSPAALLGNAAGSEPASRPISGGSRHTNKARLPVRATPCRVGLADVRDTHGVCLESRSRCAWALRREFVARIDRGTIARQKEKIPNLTSSSIPQQHPVRPAWHWVR